MARKVIWSPLALKQRKEILKFWIEHNQSRSYSIYLNRLIEDAVELVALHPYIGRLTNFENVRVKIVRDYLIFYQVESTHIDILLMWDNRQDPDSLKLTPNL